MADATSDAGRRMAFAARGVTRSYPGVVALDDVSLTGYAGEVLAICGANGAGKSTFSKLLAGQEPPSSGSIEIAGYAGTVTGPASAAEAGILMMHQEPLIVDDFSVTENVWLRDLTAGGGVHAWRLTKRDRRREAASALAKVGLTTLDPHRLGRDLGPGLRQMVALARTQVQPHSVLILDETTASTTEEHFRDVQELVRQEREAGVSVVFVSHRMPEVFALADRIAVLRNGKLVEVVRTAEVTADDVMTLMIGRAVSALGAPPDIDRAEAPVLEVSGLNSGSATDIGFSVQPGEILGIYGLVGSGRSSVIRSIAGQQSRTSGRVLVKGGELDAHSPRAGLRAGVAYLTEDRRREGFVRDFTNGLNMTLSTPRRFSRFGVLDRRRERRRIDELIREYQVKGTGDTLTRSLSGGNQQKVCIAKWLEARPDVVLLDEPTKGIDVGARLNIYEIVRALAAEGKAVVVVTSEAEEALMLCHRVLVLKDGRIVREYRPTESDTDDLIRASLAGAVA